VILQIGAFLSTLVSGVARGVGQIATQAVPGLLGIGQQFLQRELNRKLGTQQRRQVQARAVEVLNTPGISVARLGGTTQPVGGRVQRSTFTPAALTPAQSAIGNIPLLPVRLGLPPLFGGGFMARAVQGAVKFPPAPFTFPGPQPTAVPSDFFKLNGRNGTMPGILGSEIGPRFAKDEMGNTIMFVPSPRGEGFISVQQARAQNLSAMKPWWRFNRQQGQFEKIKPRRMNPFNFRAASRAGRRVERTLDAVKELVRIERKMTSGKVRFKKRKKRK